ncbi:9267_t:CDS:2 [Dentiscutata heterogama]|uniref:9267_t:CDS:1 n=1 Tax=Dentiscutata heterogama TaxID=1316150 RepID=A0ACA9Q336_9GLOM|nr:9267_t:CDS:2 [Dentiscutata heterogama]
MSSLLGLVVRLSRPAPRIFRSVAFLSSTSTLFDKHLTNSRELVKEMLRERGLPIINTTASALRKGDLKALKVNFKPVECNNKIAPEIDAKLVLTIQTSRIGSQ